MMLRLIKEFGHYDPAYSACLLSIGALHMTERWQTGDAEGLLGHAEQYLDEASGEALAVNRRARLLTDAVKGGIGRISRAADGNGNSSAASLLLKGRALSYAENYEGARDLFALVRNLSTASDANWSETARYFAADNEIRAGNFRSAIALVDEIAGAVTSQQYHRGMRKNLLLWRAYAAGDEVEARTRVAEAQRFASADAPAQAAAQLFACQGQFALMRGDLAEAGALLARAAEIGMDFTNPALLRCESDLVEVLVRLGNRREASRTLTRLEYRSSGLKSRWLRLAVSRSRALVAEGDQSLELFAQALETWQKDDSVFERARTLLCYAERLKTSGRPKDAKNSLLRAKALFEEAGAAAWTQQVDTLLLGDRVEAVPEIQNPALLLLSDHERELVQLVARGRRNKEIAASLFVSVRTVEVRLTGIYRKLGVQSRSQLTSLISAREPLSVPEPARGTSPAGRLRCCARADVAGTWNPADPAYFPRSDHIGTCFPFPWHLRASFGSKGNEVRQRMRLRVPHGSAREQVRMSVGFSGTSGHGPRREIRASLVACPAGLCRFPDRPFQASAGSDHHVSELLLIAASGLAREVLATVRSSGQYDVAGFLDDDEEMSGIDVDGAPVLGPIDDAVNYCARIRAGLPGFRAGPEDGSGPA